MYNSPVGRSNTIDDRSKRLKQYFLTRRLLNSLRTILVGLGVQWPYCTRACLSHVGACTRCQLRRRPV